MSWQISSGAALVVMIAMSSALCLDKDSQSCSMEAMLVQLA